MIKKVLDLKDESLLCYIKRDSARNYFIRLGLENTVSPFSAIYCDYDDHGNILSALFIRNTGNLQFCKYHDGDSDRMCEFINRLNYKKLIGPRSFCYDFEKENMFSRIEEGAYIAMLEPDGLKLHFDDPVKDKTKTRIKPLEVEDLVKVVSLYDKVFTSYASLEVMTQKLLTCRGRGVGLWMGDELISVAQSDFEEIKSSLIVGVATNPKFQRRGYGAYIVNYLCEALISEGKTIYLQYNSQEAGRIYKKIGFKEVDQVMHYYK